MTARKADVVLSGPHDLVLAVERHQRDVAFLAADLGVVLLSRHVNEGLDVAESVGLELGEGRRYHLRLAHQLKHQVIARHVDWLRGR